MTPIWAFTSGVSSVNSSRPTVARSRWPCSMLVNLARLVFSQSCSVLTSVVRRRLRIMVLMLSLSSATSPRASTWIERVRSPWVTAVATSAIARTWVVRLAASRFTLPVSTFHVPEAPGTFAWPPSRPSTPTSRALRYPTRYRFELAHHGVDGVLELRDLALRVHRDLARQVAARHRGRHLGDRAHLGGQVRGQQVHVLRQVLPRAAHARHHGLPA